MNKTIFLIVGLVVVTGAIFLMSSDSPETASPMPTAKSTATVSPKPSASKTPVVSASASPKPLTTASPKATPTATPKASPSSTPTAQQHTVEIKSFAFAPGSLTVKKGDKITFTNKDSAPHTATSVGTGWDSGNLSKNQSFTLDTGTLAAGTYQYICSIHPSMKGTLVVQ